MTTVRNHAGVPGRRLGDRLSYFQSISLGFECAMFLAGLIAQPHLVRHDLLERYELYIYKQWLRVYMESKMIKNNKDLFQSLDDPIALLDKLHIYWRNALIGDGHFSQAQYQVVRVAFSVGRPVSDHPAGVRPRRARADRVRALESPRQLGRPVLLPGDFTLICPTELAAFAKRHDDFIREGAVVLAASTNSCFSHKAWFETDPRLAEVRYPVVADSLRELSHSFGVLLEDGAASRHLHHRPGRRAGAHEHHRTRRRTKRRRGAAGIAPFAPGRCAG